MVNIKNILMFLFIIMITESFCIGCSFSENPSEEEIKNIIVKYELEYINRNKFSNLQFPGYYLEKIRDDDVNVSNLKFDNFQITNSFVSKKPGGDGESSPYCIEVNYKLSYKLTINLVKAKEKIIKGYKSNLSDYKSGQTGDYAQIQINRINREIDDVKQLPEIKEETKEIVRENLRLFFIKKGSKWYGGEGWT